MKILAIIIASVLFTCCEKEDSTNVYRDLNGTWFNTVSDFDAIIFQYGDTLERKNLKTGSINHQYIIELRSHEILLKYNRWDKVYIPSSIHEYYLNDSKDTLVIENFNLYYPYYEGNVFYRNK